MVTTLLRAHTASFDRTLGIDAEVLIESGTIVAVGRGLPPADHELVLAGALLPGALDLQVNGAGGRDVAEATATALDAVAAAVHAGGATAFLPTLVSAPFADLLAQLDAIATWIEVRRAAPPSPQAAVPLGIHVEGPFLDRPGAHDERAFCDPTPERVAAMLRAGRGHVALVTLSPGRAGAAAAVAQLRDADIAVALGHSGPLPDGAFAACVDAGASLVTHLGNAMDPGDHRRPGLAALALDEPRLSCSLILDGAHVHPAVVRNAWRCLGAARTVLVTDSVAAAGMPDGDYTLAGRPVRLAHGVVRDVNGTLAGSAATLATVARTFLDVVPGAGPWSLARVLATNPARLLALADRGRIAPGQRAAFTVLGDDGSVRALRID